MVNPFDVDDRVSRLQAKLRLDDWTISTVPTTEVDDAHVALNREERLATLSYNPENDDAMFYVAHEMVHVMLSDMDFLACNGRSIDIMEMYNMLEERVCNVIGALL